jgi:2-oxo-hept-3-ene-1,7-dioate hydratase
MNACAKILKRITVAPDGTTDMLSAAQIAELAASLDRAEKDRRQIGHFSKAFPGMDIDDAYAIQRAWVAMKLARGRHVIGKKIGLTSRAMQRAAQITEPDSGILLDDMLFHSGAEIEAAHFIVPRIETELAFILKKDLSGPDCTLADVLDATDHVTPALELIDARIFQLDPETKAPRKVFDTISDNAANGAIIIGGTPVKPDAIDLRWACALLYQNGGVEESGVAAAVLDHPANGVVWLANKLHGQGDSLKAGEIILSGSFTAPIPAKAGDVFRADYGPLGSIALRFV